MAIVKYECTTHNITMMILPNKKQFKTPPGSLRGVPQCYLFLAKHPEEGRHGDCVIVRDES